jgi:hypothetical protein
VLAVVTPALLADPKFIPGASRWGSGSPPPAPWNEILNVSHESSVEWMKRLIADFERRAPPYSSQKNKAFVHCLIACFLE